MSQSNLQVLLHEGELLHIVEAIHQSKGVAVGGCLFGLWRNSLTQPVIQFVTGPAQKSFREPIEDIFKNEYNTKCEEILKTEHRLLNLGYWVSGSDAERNKGKSISKLYLFSRHVRAIREKTLARLIAGCKRSLKVNAVVVLRLSTCGNYMCIYSM